MFLNQSRKEPEGELLLFDDVEDFAGEEAHALAIAHVGVQQRQRRQNVLHFPLPIRLHHPRILIRSAYIPTTVRMISYFLMADRVRLRPEEAFVSSSRNRRYTLSSTLPSENLHLHLRSMLYTDRVTFILDVGSLRDPEEVAQTGLEVAEADDELDIFRVEDLVKAAADASQRQNVANFKQRGKVRGTHMLPQRLKQGLKGVSGLAWDGGTEGFWTGRNCQHPFGWISHHLHCCPLSTYLQI